MRRSRHSAKGYCIADIQKRLEERKATYEKELVTLAAIEEAVAAVEALRISVEAKKASGTAEYITLSPLEKRDGIVYK